MIKINKKYLASFCFTLKLLDGIFRPGKIEFSESGITAYWLGSILYHLEYTDLLRVETTGRFPRWLKFVGVKDCIYVGSSYEAICIELAEREIPIIKVKKLKD